MIFGKEFTLSNPNFGEEERSKLLKAAEEEVRAYVE